MLPLITASAELIGNENNGGYRFAFPNLRSQFL
jgi:hypothetical protein